MYFIPSLEEIWKSVLAFTEKRHQTQQSWADPDCKCDITNNLTDVCFFS